MHGAAKRRRVEGGRRNLLRRRLQWKRLESERNEFRQREAESRRRFAQQTVNERRAQWAALARGGALWLGLWSAIYGYMYLSDTSDMALAAWLVIHVAALIVCIVVVILNPMPKDEHRVVPPEPPHEPLHAKLPREIRDVALLAASCLVIEIVLRQALPPLVVVFAVIVGFSALAVVRVLVVLVEDRRRARPVAGARDAACGPAS